MSSTVTQTQSSSKIDKGKGKQKETASSSASASLSLSSKVQHDNPAYNSNWIQQAVHSDFHQNIFSFEDFVKNEVKVKLDHDSQICPSWLSTQSCPLGLSCPNRHTNPSSLNFNPSSQRDNTRRTVCKHWLRGLCKKGDSCDFLHEYDLRKMPECRFFATFGFCNVMGDECLYLHVEPKAKRRECEDYRRGFCRNGPNCLKKHLRRPVCPLYLEGFCPKGPLCSLGHPKSNQPSMESRQTSPIVTVKPMTAQEAFGSGGDNNNNNYNNNSNRGGGGRDFNNRNDNADSSNVNSGGRGRREGGNNNNNNLNLNNNNSGGAGGGGGGNNNQGGNFVSSIQATSSSNGFQVLNIPPEQLANMIASGVNTTTTLKNGQIRDYSKIECFKCGNFGHFANHCPNPHNRNVQDRRR